MTKITAELLRERLVATSIPENPADVVLPPSSEHWPGRMRDRLTRALTPAGVLIPVLVRESGLAVLLTQRSAELKHHAGQVSFPGGRMESNDRDIEATALRETHEEVGIEPADVSVIGFLDPLPTITGYAVTPVIGFVPESVDIVVDRSEVEYAFEVPLDFLLDSQNQRAGTREFDGATIPIVEFLYEDQRIWGATANILVILRNILFS